MHANSPDITSRQICWWHCVGVWEREEKLLKFIVFLTHTRAVQTDFLARGTQSSLSILFDHKCLPFYPCLISSAVLFFEASWKVPNAVTDSFIAHFGEREEERAVSVYLAVTTKVISCRNFCSSTYSFFLINFYTFSRTNLLDFRTNIYFYTLLQKFTACL